MSLPRSLMSITRLPLAAYTGIGVMLLSQIKCIPGCELAYAATTIAVALSNEFDNADLNILSSFFNAIGDSLGIIASQREALKNCMEKSAENQDLSH